MTEPPEEPPERESEKEGSPEEGRPPLVPEPDIDDFERIRFYVTDGRILAARLEGPRVGRGEIDADVAGDFLVRVEKLVHGIAATLRGLAIPRRGAIPRPEGSAPLRLNAVLAARSVFEFLATEEVDTLWRAAERPTVRVDRGQAHYAISHLRTEAPPISGDVEVAGDLFRADSHRNTFRLEPREGPTIAGTYSADLVEAVRQAWAKNVLVRLKQTEHRWVYSRDPREVVYERVQVVEILGPVGHEAPDADDEPPF